MHLELLQPGIFHSKSIFHLPLSLGQAPVKLAGLANSLQFVYLHPMTLEDIQRLCLSFPGVQESIKFEHHLCFTVGGKIFILTSPDDVPPTACIKVEPETFEMLAEREGFKQAPYFAKKQWIWMDNLNRLQPSEWKSLLETAYRLIVAKLPVKQRKELGLL